MGRRKGPSLTRQQVVEAAIGCVRNDGPDALGVARVARSLGIQPPSIYNHIGKGDALARAVVAEASRQMLVALDHATQGEADPAEQLRALAWGMREWALANRNLYALMARIEPDNEHPDFAPLLARMLELFRRPLVSLGVPQDHVIHAIRGLRAILHGFVLLEATGQFKFAQAPKESYEWAIGTFLRGLSHRPPSESPR